MAQRPYKRESALVSDFTRHLRGPNSFRPVSKIRAEFDYGGGKADLVALTTEGEVIAFEAKLSRWRVALHQAYRAQGFAHRSFVVLPEAAAALAIYFEEEFLRRRVGLLVVNGNGVRALIEAQASPPLLPWLNARAAAFLRMGRGKISWGNSISEDSSTAFAVHAA